MPLFLSIHRYILWLLTPFWVGLIAGLVFLAAMVNSLNFLAKVINDNMSIWLLLKFVSFGMPVAVWLVTPITLYLAIMVVYSRLRNDTETVVMQSCGISQFSLGRPAIVLGLVGGLLMAYLVASVIPGVNRAFRDAKNELVFALTPSAIREGVFFSPVQGITLYIREKAQGSTYRGFIMHDQRDPKHPMTVTADEARLEELDGNFAIVLTGATRFEQRQDEAPSSLLNFDRHVYSYTPDRSYTDRPYIKPRELYMGELVAAVRNKTTPKYTNGYIAELIDRLTTPLLPLGYALLALSIINQGQQGRRGTSTQTLVAVASLVGVEVLRFSAKSLASESTAAAPILVVAELMPFVLALVFWQAMNLQAWIQAMWASRHA
jgi:lipopolysaccharide export system permease protein